MDSSFWWGVAAGAVGSVSTLILGCVAFVGLTERINRKHGGTTPY